MSINDAGVQGNAVSSSSFISADSRFVVFESDASNLVAAAVADAVPAMHISLLITY